MHCYAKYHNFPLWPHYQRKDVHTLVPCDVSQKRWLGGCSSSTGVSATDGTMGRVGVANKIFPSDFNTHIYCILSSETLLRNKSEELYSAFKLLQNNLFEVAK